jgi:NitT/TauT family transport system substrate-binding protein
MIQSSRRSLLSALFALAAISLGAGACDSKPKPEESKPSDKSGTPTAGGDPSPTPTAGPDKEYKIAWSVWTGWMPFKLMEEKGFLAERAKKHGVKVKLVEFKGYMDSVQAFAAKKVDGVAMTSMESLQPASNGVDSVAIVVNDVSNGGDGLLVRPNLDVKALKGKTVLLEEFSVSHYLLARALEKAGLKEADLKVKNIPGDEAGKAFLTDTKVEAVATWNPHLFQATEAGKGKVVFSSKDIPGEIIDFLVVSGDALKETPKLGTALTEAWYDAMKHITEPGTRTEAIEIMAKAAGASVQEFNKMLADTDLYTDRARARQFLESQTLKDTMEKVKQFSFDKGLIKDQNFQISYGSSGPGKLRFDSTYCAAQSE